MRSYFVPFVLVALACSTAAGQTRPPRTRPARNDAASYAELRNKMVEEDIVAAGIKDVRVVEAIRKTPRHEFVPLGQRIYSYYDMALPIGEQQTISPPFVVAYMTEAIEPQPTDSVLEIGTGSGYQAAVLSGLVKDVYSIEIVAPLGERAAKTLSRLHYVNVHTKIGDGYQGWPEHAPFDKIIVTCSPEKVPPALIAQLKEGGRMIIPVGERYQQSLVRMTKVEGKMKSENLLPTLFVPMTGTAEDLRQVKPDPTRPALRNGDFEELTGEPPAPVGWHYQRQLEVVAADDAPSGKHYVVFRNSDPGRAAQALQAVPVDGRKVPQIEVSANVRLKDVRPGQNPQQLPCLGVVFYDENRGMVGARLLGPWHGTAAWHKESKRIDVPPRAREAVLRVALMGAVGEYAVDDIRVRAVPNKEEK